MKEYSDMKLIKMYSSKLSKYGVYLEGPWQELAITYYPKASLVEIVNKTLGFNDNTRVPKP